MGQNLRRLSFFASKNAMDISHLGPEIMKKLIEYRLIVEIPDLYRLTKQGLSQIEGFKEKSIKNLLQSIEDSKQTTLARFIFAMGIPYVGQGIATLIAKHTGSIDKLRAMSVEELCAIDGIGNKLAHSIVEFFKDPIHQREINTLPLHSGFK